MRLRMRVLWKLWLLTNNTCSHVKQGQALRIGFLCTDSKVTQIEVLTLTRKYTTHRSSSESLSIGSHQRRFRGSYGVAGTDSGYEEYTGVKSLKW
jgi:hypothetical protein